MDPSSNQRIEQSVSGIDLDSTMSRLFLYCVLLTLVALSRQVLAHELHDRQISHMDEQYLLRGVDIFHESALAIGTDKAISHDYRKM